MARRGMGMSMRRRKNGCAVKLLLIVGQQCFLARCLVVS
jgi:hypothetical protein